MNDFDLLILGTRKDPHVKIVSARLTENGIDHEILDHLDRESFLDVRQTAEAVDVVVNGRRLADGGKIWDRSKILRGSPFFFDDHLEGESRSDELARYDFRRQEWRAALQALQQIRPGLLINDLTAKTSFLKPKQQAFAIAQGVKTPPSLVTNSKAAVADFISRYENCIIKSLSGARAPNREGTEGDEQGLNLSAIMTMPITAADCEELSQDDFWQAPVFLQQKIEKKLEVRAFCFGQEANAFSVDSQAFKTTHYDWRLGSYFLNFEPYEVDPDIAVFIRAFLKEFGLFYGSFDFIVDAAGCWWFLECNPDGQWLWLDDLNNPVMTCRFADAMTARLGTGKEWKGSPDLVQHI